MPRDQKPSELNTQYLGQSSAASEPPTNPHPASVTMELPTSASEIEKVKQHIRWLQTDEVKGSLEAGASAGIDALFVEVQKTENQFTQDMEETICKVFLKYWEHILVVENGALSYISEAEKAKKTQSNQNRSHLDMIAESEIRILQLTQLKQGLQERPVIRETKISPEEDEIAAEDELTESVSKTEDFFQKQDKIFKEINEHVAWLQTDEIKSKLKPELSKEMQDFFTKVKEIAPQIAKYANKTTPEKRKDLESQLSLCRLFLRIWKHISELENAVCSDVSKDLCTSKLKQSRRQILQFCQWRKDLRELLSSADGGYCSDDSDHGEGPLQPLQSCDRRKGSSDNRHGENKRQSTPPVVKESTATTPRSIVTEPVLGNGSLGLNADESSAGTQSLSQNRFALFCQWLCCPCCCSKDNPKSPTSSISVPLFPQKLRG